MTTMRALGALPGEVPIGGERLRRSGVDRVVLGYAVLWCLFIITGFRLPWVPIDAVTDTGSTMRQILFTVGALIALRRMLVTSSLSQILAQHRMLILVGAWMMASFVYSADTWLTVKRSIIYVFGLLMLLCTIHAHPHPTRTFLALVTHALGALAWGSLIASVVLPPECTSIALRPGLAGLSVHPNSLGPCLQIGLLLSLGMSPKSRKHRVLLGGQQVGLLVALIQTDSVTSIIATFVGWMFFVTLTARTYQAGLIQVAIAVSLIAVTLIGLDTVREAFFEAAGRDATLSGRDELWSAVFREGLDHPVFGLGYGAFWYENRGWELTHTWNPRQSHHAYLDVFVELGIAGLLLVLMTVHWKLLMGWQKHAGQRRTRQRRAVTAILAMAVSLCCVTAFSESFFLKLDKIQFFVLCWGVLLLDNRDTNNIEAEFRELTAEDEDEITNRARPFRTRLGHHL
jgi:exopolysaccharide production protein ExoQ